MARRWKRWRWRWKRRWKRRWSGGNLPDAIVGCHGCAGVIEWGRGRGRRVGKGEAGGG